MSEYSWHLRAQTAILEDRSGVSRTKTGAGTQTATAPPPGTTQPTGPPRDQVKEHPYRSFPPTRSTGGGGPGRPIPSYRPGPEKPPLFRPHPPPPRRLLRPGCRVSDHAAPPAAVPSPRHQVRTAPRARGVGRVVQHRPVRGTYLAVPRPVHLCCSHQLISLGPRPLVHPPKEPPLNGVSPAQVGSRRTSWWSCARSTRGFCR
jgi:hypothetical protein